jgi:hypothetical protein
MADNVSGRRKGKYIIIKATQQEKQKAQGSSETSVRVSSEEDKQLDKKSDRTPTKSSDASVYVSSEEYTLSDKKSAAAGNKKSEEYYMCDPCKNVGDNVWAGWFCSGCKVYLCSMCFESHQSSKSPKNHVVTGKDDMSPRKSLKFCTPCKIVGAKVKPAGYCEDCCCYLCDECCKCHSRDELTKHHVLEMIKAAVDGIGRDATASISKINIKDKMTGEENTNEEFTYVRDINIASDTDKKEECLIIDMTLVSDNALVLCDASNKCLKLMDITIDKIKDVLPLQSKPLSVTAMSNDQVAIVLKDCYLIQILNIRGKLVIDRTIKTNGITAAVRMVNKHLFVSFWKPVKFQKLQPTGSIIKTIKPDDEVRKCCFFPHNFAVNTDETVMYISDGELHNVLSIDMQGNLLNLYQGELECPYGIIIVPSGSVYVCNRNQNIVYKMKSDLSEATVMLGPGDGLTGPQAMYVNTDDQHLYISSGCFENKHFLKVYKC